MANIAANVRVGINGAFYTGPLKTPLPNGASAPVDQKFKDLGYISDDGVAQTIDSDTSEIKAWQNGDVVRVIQTSHKVSFKMTLIETNEEVLRLYYADPTATSSLVKMTGNQAPHFSGVFDVLDGDKIIRVTIPDGQVTERGDVNYKGEVIGYEITVTCYPDSSGVKAYLHLGSK